MLFEPIKLSEDGSYNFTFSKPRYFESDTSSKILYTELFAFLNQRL